MAPNTSETFGTHFKKLRLQAGISTLKKFGDLLDKRGYTYEDSMFSHWQIGKKIPMRRSVIIAMLEIFRERNPHLTLEECNKLLSTAEQGYLTDYERKELNITASSVPFLAPPKVSYFTGREKEIAEISEIISFNKIIQISGQAGVGKTALAIELAHRYASLFSDGILWYRIDTTDAASILNHIAKIYGENIDDLKDLQFKNYFIRTLLENKKVLIVLDNVEQKNIKNLHFLLIPGDTIRYIFTTQQSYLRIDPSPYFLKLNSFNETEIQNLYKKVVSPIASKHFVFFCKNYGYLPLVAATLARRIKYFKTNNMISNLDDILSNTSDFFAYEDKNLYQFFDKTRTILSSVENRLWISTATFNAIDFSEEAIQYINGLSSTETKKILEKLFSLSLIEKSSNKRWRVHPAIKNYLSPFLDKSMYYALIDYYSATFRRDENGYKNLYPKIEKEFDELRFLFQYCLENNSLDHAVREWEFFSIYLWDRGYWYMLRNFGEGLLSLAYKKDDITIAATIIVRDLSWLYIWQGELLKTYKLLSNKQLHEVIKNDKLLLGTKHQQLGFIFSQHKLLQKALTHLKVAQIIFEETSNSHNSAKTFMYTGHVYEKVGDLTNALLWYEKSLDAARKYNFMETESKAHYYIGEVYKKRGDFKQAKEHFITALSIDDAVKRRAGVGWNKHSLSEIAQAEGDIDLAVKLHREAHEAFTIVGVNPSLH